MNKYEYKILKVLNQNRNGLSIDELAKKSGYENAESINIILSDMDTRRLIFTRNEEDKKFKITGTGEDALKNEIIYKRTYILTVANVMIAIVSMLIAAVALILSVSKLPPQIVQLIESLLS